MIEQTTTGRTIMGKVVSNKMNKTIVVLVERKVKHTLYGKYLKRFSKLYAHDEGNTCSIGDIVRIKSSRPLSKLKNWVLAEVVERADKEAPV